MTSPCIHPFIEESLFADSAGAVSGRWCEESGNVSCCLPCPVSYWVWKDITYLADDVRAFLWPDIPVLIALVWLLLTYAIFPANMTDCHYLSVSPVIGFLCIAISFLISSVGPPKECHNTITPNNMQTEARCALMGAVLFFGAWVVILSCFFRPLVLHLSACWQIIPGKKFKIFSLCTIFIGSAVLVAIELSISGVQYTFGRICYIIPSHDRETTWGPLLGAAIASLLLQIVTVIYCVALLVRPYINYQKLRWYGYTPSIQDTHSLDAQRTASSVKKILQMQWRPILIALLILTYVVYLAVVFMKLRQFHDYPTEARHSWFQCLASSDGNKAPCLPLTESFGPSEAELLAVTFMLIPSGLLAVVILFRSSMIRAWIQLLKGKKRSNSPSICQTSDQTRSGTDNNDVEIAN